MEGRSYVTDIDNLKATELTLGLPGADTSEKATQGISRGSKRTLADATEEPLSKSSSSEIDSVKGGNETCPPVAKAQVVGWPPIRSYRKNSFQERKEPAEATGTGIYVKVSMDGVPYLRKIDLQVYKGYKELREALRDMFKCFSLGMEGQNGSEYAVTYEDKDGDWMLVGDVPWGMFISSCKRLRIMRGTESRGLSSSS